ncbi:MAG: methyltransferase domain-containing protein [Arcobacter sp.]|nr:methyltransferase domain-containing protein [Arcobacter sp.]
MNKFTSESMFEIVKVLKKDFIDCNNLKLYEFEVLNPDLYKSSYSGEIVLANDTKYIYRSYKSWIDLAQKLFCKMLTPIKSSENSVIIRFEKLNQSDSFHNKDSNKEEKYGQMSTFSKINKNEEPEVLISYLESLINVNVKKRSRILNLGVNTAEEFDLIKDYCNNFSNIEFVGIDYCDSAIKIAKEKYIAYENVKFYAHDINKLEELDLGKFDLIISVGTLQSSNLDFNKTFMNIVQNYLNNNGSMILGFPNCRWIDGEIIYGAKAPNYSYSEMSILYKDAYFCKKYLQQKKFRVTLTGKYYIFLTATSIRK